VKKVYLKVILNIYNFYRYRLNEKDLPGYFTNSLISFLIALFIYSIELWLKIIEGEKYSIPMIRIPLLWLLVASMNYFLVMKNKLYLRYEGQVSNKFRIVWLIFLSMFVIQLIIAIRISHDMNV
jgi:hypothetical protein